MVAEPLSRFYDAADGLRLHYLDFMPSAPSDAMPVVCLAGLTRGALDFGVLGNALACASPRPRRVLAFDNRGRGQSDHDGDWRHYDLATERADVLAGLALAGVERAHFVGTSRGGLHIMALAATHRAMIRSVVLNDIGPVLEPEGLRRIKSYVGQMVEPRTLDEAVKVLRIGAGSHFDGLSAEEWRVFATTTFGDAEGDLRLRYDPQLARTLDSFDLDRPLPESWDLFDGLRDRPLLTIRGANSDLLSEATLARMDRAWSRCESITVAGQGHAPLLADAATIARITTFLDASE